VDLNPYGQGVSWPFRFGGTGGLAESAGVRRVEESIRVILGTQYGQRLMRPDFGCNLMSLVFAPNNSSTANLARFYVEESLTRWEPRIDLVDVVVDNDQARDLLLITVSYRLKGAGDLREITYPFGLEAPQ
jgi:phage baseplate assembly protein W